MLLVCFGAWFDSGYMFFDTWVLVSCSLFLRDGWIRLLMSIQRFLVRQWVRKCQSTEAWVLFPFSAQCLVLWGTCCASVTWCFWSDILENCGFSAVAVHRRSWCRGRFPWSCLRKTIETPQLQYLPGGRCSCCAGRVPCPLLSTSAHGPDPAEIR